MRQPVRAFFAVGSLLSPVFLSSTANARLISRWTFERIAREAEALVAGEVVDVATIGSIPSDKTRWKTPLLRKSARIRVLRFVVRLGSTGLVEKQEINLEFCVIDWGKARGGGNGPTFPGISAGDVTVFPLRRAPPAKGTEWELIDEEDFGLLVPSLRERRGVRQAEPALDFLRLELAGVLSGGTRPDIHKAAEYLSSWGCRGESLRAVVQLVSDEVKDDEARWLSLAAACYAVGGVPRPKLFDLRDSPQGGRPELAFAAEALDRIHGEVTVDRFLEETFNYVTLNPWGVGVTICNHGRQHPTAVRLLIEALRAGVPEAVYVAQYVVRDGEHPVVPDAIDTARRLLPRKFTFLEFGFFRAACVLIRDYGSEEDFEFLLAEIKKAKKEDRQRYEDFWGACAYVKNPRLIRIIRLFVDDRGQYGGMRLCDLAAFRLQHVTGEDFGASSGLGISERDKVVEKARAWLAAHAPSSAAALSSIQPEDETGQPDSGVSGTWAYVLLIIALLGLLSVAAWFLLRRKSA